MRRVVYGFHRRHADAIESGVKRRTIRRVGKRAHAQPGDAVRLYTGLRTRDCRLLGDAVCVGSHAVRLEFVNGALVGGRVGRRKITDPETFARDDGFANAADMARFFEQLHGAGDFRGVMIEWGPLSSPAPTSRSTRGRR